MKVKLGVLGVGHLGKIHLNCLRELDEQFELVGFYDPDTGKAHAVADSFELPMFDSLDALFDRVDAVDIVAPTSLHFDLAIQALNAGKHIFVEKPVVVEVEDGHKLVRRAAELGLVAQVGHVERFNPAFLAVSNMALNPMFIESHRLAEFNPRGTDVSVVLDLMIHDLDLILQLVPSPVSRISASGVNVVSDTLDICNVRIEFENGCTANVTASRMALKRMRKMRLFQPDAYISMDFLEKKTQIVQISSPGEHQSSEEGEGSWSFDLDLPSGARRISVSMPESPPVNSIREELRAFGESIRYSAPVSVPLSDGVAALELAQEILAHIEKNRLAISLAGQNTFKR